MWLWLASHGKQYAWHAAQVVIDALFFWQEEHCKAAYFAEYERKHLPGEYRK